MSGQDTKFKYEYTVVRYEVERALNSIGGQVLKKSGRYMEIRFSDVIL